MNNRSNFVSKCIITWHIKKKKQKQKTSTELNNKHGTSQVLVHPIVSFIQVPNKELVQHPKGNRNNS